jgi:hypothetical protein
LAAEFAAGIASLPNSPLEGLERGIFAVFLHEPSAVVNEGTDFGFLGIVMPGGRCETRRRVRVSLLSQVLQEAPDFRITKILVNEIA